MESDIVARLRVYSKSTIDGGWATVFRADMNIAGDEIERLREERDAVRRKFCKMCASVGGVYRRVGRENVECRTAEEIAEICGWDCFKENTDEH